MTLYNGLNDCMHLVGRPRLHLAVELLHSPAADVGLGPAGVAQTCPGGLVK